MKTPLPESAGRKFVRSRRILAVVLVLVTALSFYVADTIYHANFHVVVRGEAYRSGQMNAEQFAHIIEEYHIKSILNLRGENPGTEWHQAEIATAAKFKVVHYDRSLGSGTPPTLGQMDGLVTLLRQAPKPILIHCFGGADRTGLVCALYCLAVAGQTPREADRELSIWYGHVPLIRPRVIAMDDSFWYYVSNRVIRSESKLQPIPPVP